MTVTAIVGAQYGSEGKGAFVHALAPKVDVAVRTGGPNAGHSFWHDGHVWKMRQLPVPWTNPDCELVLGAGAIIDPIVLREEEDATERIAWIDYNAAFILPSDKAEEQDIVNAIGSTGEGVGAARIGKIRRLEKQRLARFHDEYALTDTTRMLHEAIDRGARVLLEGTQGSGLSLHHGQWPYVTSNDTNAAQLLADAGIPPSSLTHTLLVMRTYPIRVGGPSGPMYEEMRWGDIPSRPLPEHTTVTNRERRVGQFDFEQVEKAIRLNAPCGLVVTFLDYLDPDIKNNLNRPSPAWEFVDRVTEQWQVPVVAGGIGGERFEVLNLNTTCLHGEFWP